ncbi:MAG: polymer-forming cytoskeletal protein [Prevotella sp.]|nr:polymer-forming cytoskeletal protein [Prevotella sp.]
MTKTVLALLIAFGVQATASAQFGNVLNRAKYSARSKVESKIDQAIDNAIDKGIDKATDAAKEQFDPNKAKNTTSDGGIQVLYGSDNFLVGTYYPDTKVFKIDGNDITYTFQDDGAVMGQDGKQKGLIKDGNVSSGKIYNILVQDNGDAYWNNGKIGSVSDDGQVVLFDSNIAHATQPMDKRILAFCVYGVLYKTGKMQELQKNYQEGGVGGYTMTRTTVTTSGGNSSSGEAVLYKGGSIFGKLKNDGTVIINGSNKGQIRSNGSIYVGGSNVGTLRSNGDVLKSGSIIGNIDSNGNVRIKGSIVGKVESNGDVRKSGSIIGKAKNMTNLRHVAIIYFFGFYHF